MACKLGLDQNYEPGYPEGRVPAQRLLQADAETLLQWIPCDLGSPWLAGECYGKDLGIDPFFSRRQHDVVCIDFRVPVCWCCSCCNSCNEAFAWPPLQHNAHWAEVKGAVYGVLESVSGYLPMICRESSQEVARLHAAFCNGGNRGGS